MEFKGIKWAGNLYEKIEAMCLQMEEVMYQDTVKYLEGQVHTVGASVKKFYSEVMEDFLPPSCGDLVKVATPDLQINPYSHVGVAKKTKKPNQIIRRDPKDIKTKEFGDSEGMDGINPECKSSLAELDGVLYSQTSGDNFSAKGCPDLYPGKRKSGGLYRRPTVGSKGSANWGRTSEISGSSPLSTSTGRISSLHENRNETIKAYQSTRANGSNKGSCNLGATSEISGSNLPSWNTSRSSSLHEIRRESVNKVHESTHAIDCSCLTDKDVCVSDLSHSPAAPDSSSSCETQKKDGPSPTPTPDICPEPIGSVTHEEICSQMEPTADSSACTSRGEDVISTSQGRLDKCDTEVLSNVVESGLDIVERLAESKFEETCVVVEEDEVQAVSQKEGKHKSYKKKIREAFSSKIRSTRKQECKNLAAQYSAEAAKLDNKANSGPTPSEDLNPEELQAHGIPDSEWELL